MGVFLGLWVDWLSAYRLIFGFWGGTNWGTRFIGFGQNVGWAWGKFLRRDWVGRIRA